MYFSAHVVLGWFGVFFFFFPWLHVERKKLALWAHLYLIFHNYGLFCDIFHGDKLFDDVWPFFLLSLSQLDILHISVIIKRKNIFIEEDSSK